MDKFDKLIKGMNITVGEKSLIQKSEEFKTTVGDVNTSTSRVGLAESARERLFRSFGVREVDIQKAYGDENVKDQHGESWHTDNDKLVHKITSTAGETETHDQDTQREAASVTAKRKEGKRKPGVTAKSEDEDEENPISKARKLMEEDDFFSKAFGDDRPDEEKEEPEEEVVEEKDEASEEAKKEEKKEAPKGAKKSELDELCDLIKGCSTPRSEMNQKKLKREAEKMKNLHENSEDSREQQRPAEKSMPNFIKDSGKGGIVFDFGNVTGNGFADRANAMLERHGDPIQKNIASDQAREYSNAIGKYVKEGEQSFMSKNSGRGPGVDLDTPMDKQVENEFKKSQEQVQVQAQSFGEKTINIAGENVQAASETDAALIEMMNSGGMDFSESEV